MLTAPDRLTAWLRLAGTHLLQPRLQQGCLKQPAQDHIQAAFDDLQGDPTASLGNLCHCSIAYTAQECCLVLRASSVPVCATCPGTGHPQMVIYLNVKGAMIKK